MQPITTVGKDSTYLHYGTLHNEGLCAIGNYCLLCVKGL